MKPRTQWAGGSDVGRLQRDSQVSEWTHYSFAIPMPETEEEVDHADFEEGTFRRETMRLASRKSGMFAAGRQS